MKKINFQSKYYQAGVKDAEELINNFKQEDTLVSEISETNWKNWDATCENALVIDKN